MKPGDHLALPLCNGCHRLLHSMGELKFWQMVMKDMEALRKFVCSYARSLYGGGLWA